MAYDNKRDEQELFKSFTSMKTLSKIAHSLYTWLDYIIDSETL